MIMSIRVMIKAGGENTRRMVLNKKFVRYRNFTGIKYISSQYALAAALFTQEILITASSQKKLQLNTMNQ